MLLLEFEVSFACTSLDFSKLRNVKQNIPKESLATALPLLLRKCNGDARKKLLESTFLNTLWSSHNLLNCVNLTTRFCGKNFNAESDSDVSNSFSHHKNYSSMMSLWTNNHSLWTTYVAFSFFNSFSENLQNSPITELHPIITRLHLQIFAYYCFFTMVWGDFFADNRNICTAVFWALHVFVSFADFWKICK